MDKKQFGGKLLLHSDLRGGVLMGNLRATYIEV